MATTEHPNRNVNMIQLLAIPGNAVDTEGPQTGGGANI